MLNPFAIEKDILNKMASIKKVVNVIKETVGAKILQKANRYCFDIDQDILEQCTTMIAQSTVNSKIYFCKICKKTFNDGRKLGGHVSRAHKQGEQQDSEQQCKKEYKAEQISFTPKPKRKSTRLMKCFLKQSDCKMRVHQDQDSSVMYKAKNKDTREVEREDLYFSSQDQRMK